MRCTETGPAAASSAYSHGWRGECLAADNKIAAAAAAAEGFAPAAAGEAASEGDWLSEGDGGGADAAEPTHRRQADGYAAGGAVAGANESRVAPAASNSGAEPAAGARSGGAGGAGTRPVVARGWPPATGGGGSMRLH